MFSKRLLCITSVYTFKKWPNDGSDLIWRIMMCTTWFNTRLETMKWTTVTLFSIFFHALLYLLQQYHHYILKSHVYIQHQRHSRYIVLQNQNKRLTSFSFLLKLWKCFASHGSGNQTADFQVHQTEVYRVQNNSITSSILNYIPDK